MNVLDAAFNVVHDQPGGAGAMALRMGKRPSTLSHELRHEGFAKLGLVDAVKISQLSNDRRILSAFASECECMVLQLPSAGDETDVMHSVAEMAADFSALVAHTISADADKRITKNELDGITRAFADLVASGQHLIGQLQARHDAGKPTTEFSI